MVGPLLEISAANYCDRHMCVPYQMDADDMGDMPGMPGGGMPGGMGGMGGLGGLLNDPELMASMTDPV